MARTLLTSLLALALAGCGSAAVGPRTHRDVTAGPVPAGTSGSTSMGGMSVGGMGTQWRFDGVAGGPNDASAVDPSCRGWIPAAPQIQFDLGMPSSIVASATSGVDTTMVVLFPDGRIACNDDTNGLNPEVRGEFPAGHYRIFIGTYSQGNSGPFHAEVGPPS